MPDPGLTEVTISPFQAGPGQIISARSYLIDRFVPDCEIITLPAKTVAGGSLRFGAGAFVPKRRPSGLKARLKVPRRGVRQVSGSVFDFRTHTPQNWAHFLNNHLPLFFRIAAELALNWDEAQIIVPADMPKNLFAVADLFGLSLLATDDDLIGDGILFDVDPWTAQRSARAQWVATDQVQQKLASLTGDAFARRVFLARRKTRNIANQAEVESFLSRFGFVTLYPEDLSVQDQFRLFAEAETIVAVHGAGLAPMLYRSRNSRLQQLIEILPCGHMTDVYRVMAAQVGCAWIGVRGRIKPEYVAAAYDLSAPFKTYSLDAFSVDVAALEQAFSLAEYPIKE